VVLKDLTVEMFRVHSKAPRIAYVASGIVLVLFLLAGHDEPLSGMWPYYASLLLCLVQFALPTFAGWSVLVALSIWYIMNVALRISQVERFDYWLFLSCGVVPLILLWIYRPRSSAMEH